MVWSNRSPSDDPTALTVRLTEVGLANQRLFQDCSERTDKLAFDSHNQAYFDLVPTQKTVRGNMYTDPNSEALHDKLLRWKKKLDSLNFAPETEVRGSFVDASSHQ